MQHRPGFLIRLTLWIKDLPTWPHFHRDSTSSLISNVQQPPVGHAGIKDPEARALLKVTGWSTMKQGYKARQQPVLDTCVLATWHSAKSAGPTSSSDNSASPLSFSH